MVKKFIINCALASVAATPVLHAHFKAGTQLPDISEQDQYYAREEIPMPEGKVLEIGSIALMSDQKIAVSTRRGEIWIVSGAYEKDVSKASWKLAFNGAHEPFGMFEKDGWLHFTDRDAYARIGDTDNNGTYETYEVISNKWGMNGDYHEYNFGSTPDKDGNVYVVHCLTGSANANSPWRGWCQKIAPDGQTTPFASGVRSPGGIGFNYEGELFYTDNQGFWNGTSCLKHVKEGSFTGCPIGNKYYKDAPHMGKQPVDPAPSSLLVTEAERIPELVPPAVQLPHGKIGQSPTAIISDLTNGRFGPFKNQLLIGEQTHSQIQRVFLEQVNGIYQGAVWHFLGGFRSGIIPARLADDGTLFVGGSNRGWASAGGKQFTLERVRWKGVTPFSMEKVEAQPSGFKITFTDPVDPASVAIANSISAQAWTYQYHGKYGSPEINKLTPAVTKVELTGEKELTITLDKLTKGHIHHLVMPQIKNKAGKALWHKEVYYTLNQIPTE